MSESFQKEFMEGNHVQIELSGKKYLLTDILLTDTINQVDFHQALQLMPDV